MQVEGCTLSPLCGDGEEEDLELSVLPKNTKVVVTGNNRTNRDLLGLHGVVKKAVGFGWHWLVLTNGSEVKLQRNALSVIELPTGQEEDGENDCEHPSSNNNSMDLGCDDLHKTYKPKSRSRVLGGSSSRNHSHSAQLQSTGSNFHSHGMLVCLLKILVHLEIEFQGYMNNGLPSRFYPIYVFQMVHDSEGGFKQIGNISLVEVLEAF
ncbi:uncharacterized protein LOC131039958 isoform X2 [Cryptomeria japonica]|uniref:uncharacterized protein LOC131039958 isoform X2 n=1 Tax=Cryptomeria japonica TaxID=3369 RepID=UPI0025ACF4E5|nr:uncharacterized protein LOC131039958 isoform X2 [Cryptomeria japonica]